MNLQSRLTAGLTAALAGCLYAQVASAQTFGSSRGGLFDDDAAGFSRVAAGCTASGVAIQVDRKIVGVGTHVEPGDNRVIVVRFRTDGTLDTSFGEQDDDARTGFVQFSVGSNCNAESVAVTRRDTSFPPVIQIVGVSDVGSSNVALPSTIDHS